MSYRLNGQTTSLEFFIVSSIVVIIVVSSIHFYETSLSRASASRDKMDLEFLSIDIMDSLVRTEGIPTGWEDYVQDTSSFGLAGSPQVLDWRKVKALIDFNYASSKSIMGIGSHEYSFRIKHVNGTVLAQSGLPPSSPKIAINSMRSAVLNGTAVNIDFILWRR